MCYLPVHVAMICFLFKSKQGHIPITQTKIYEEFTCCMMSRHLKRYDSKAQLESLQDLRGNDKKEFDKLCRLAYNMTTESVQVISEDMDIYESEIGHAEDKYLGLVTISRTCNPE